MSGRDRSSQSRARDDDDGEDGLVDVDSLAAFFADHTKFPQGREGRVQYCMLLMASGRWERGKTAKDIAAAADLAVNSVEDISAEASRRVKSAMNTEEARGIIVAAAIEGIRQALSMHNPKAIQALSNMLKVYADVTGSMAPKKHEVTGKDGVPLFPGTNRTLESLTEAELEAFAEKGETPKPN